MPLTCGASCLGPGVFCDRVANGKYLPIFQVILGCPSAIVICMGNFMPDSNKPELISFDLCPFVQRSVITLLEKNVEFDLTYIDLGNKPDWFLAISPLGKVPVLREKGEVLFESAVINEYLDETNPPSLHPADPLKKAQNRAWIEVGSNQLMHSFRMMMAETREDSSQS